MVTQRVEDSSEEGENVAKPLSLLVDGEDIVEAILVSAGKIYCYPCKFEDWIRVLIDFLENIFASGLIPSRDGYVIIGCGKNKVVAIPLSRDKFLAVIAKEYIDGEKLARYLSSLPDRLGAVLEKKRRGENQEK